MNGYEIIRLIGRGAYGDALLCRQISNKSLCVVKQIRIDTAKAAASGGGGAKPDIKQVRTDSLGCGWFGLTSCGLRYQLANEVEVLVKCGTTGHPNVIRYRTSFIHTGASGTGGTGSGGSGSGTELCIVMDWYDGGDLQHKIKARTHHFQESDILDYFVQLCFGLKHIHDHKVLHRDVKASNIFIDRTSTGIEILKIGSVALLPIEMICC